MASTYSDLKFELIGTGEQVGTWGATTNTNLGTAIEEAITGSADVTFSSADVTIALTNTNATQTARNLRLVCIGTSGGARQLILGSGCQINKLYLVQNDLADAVTVKNTTGTGVSIAAGAKKFVFNNGTNVVEAIDVGLTSVNLASNVTGTLPIANGGTGATSLTANNVLVGNGTSAIQTVAPSTSGNVLTSNGTTWVSQALPPSPGAFTTGMIMLWSGSIASIPSGWALCNGSNGTPDLRNRFIIGAGFTYAVAATGGSKDAIVVSHTHTASTASTGSHQHVVSTGAVSGVVGLAAATNWESPGGTSLGQTASAGAHSHTVTVNSTGSSGTDANLPPYYALAYIMKT